MLFSKIRLQTKVSIYFSVLVVFLISVATAFLYFYSKETATKGALESLVQLTVKSSQQMDSLLQNMDYIALQLMINPTILEYFSSILHDKENTDNYFETNVPARIKIADMMASIDGPNLIAVRISVSNQSGDYVHYGILPDDASVGDKFIKSGMIAKFHSELLSDSNHRLILPPHQDFWSNDSQRLLISVIRLLQNVKSNIIYGVVETQQNYDKFESLFTELHDIKAYVFTESGQLVYPCSQTPTENSTQLKYYYSAIQNNNKGAFKKVNPVSRKTEFISYCKSSYSGWIVVLTQTEESLAAPYRVTSMLLVIIGAALILLTIIIIMFISDQLVKPLKRLKKSIGSVSLENLSIDIINTGNHNEIVQLNQAFDSMFKRLKASVAYEVKAHLLALQSQMNPHFLYNTLSLISAAGQELGSEKIMDLCRKLSSMLRYTSNFSETGITIKDEIEHAANYLDLMKERYEDYVTYRFNINHECLDIKVPKLVLQPMLENCFQHGFANTTPPWVIDIAIDKNDGYWFMKVSDNGSGIEEEVIKSIILKAEKFTKDLSENIQDMKLGGLGLLNTYVRLKLLYSDNMIFRIEKNSPSGSIITFGGSIHD